MAIVKFWGIPFFEVDYNILRLQPLNMYLLIEHYSLILYDGEYVELKKFKFAFLGIPHKVLGVLKVILRHCVWEGCPDTLQSKTVTGTFPNSPCWKPALAKTVKNERNTM